MNRMVICALMGSFATLNVSTQAIADDSNSARPIVSPKQMMKDCMAKERQANSGVSEDD
jgi:hypothetical protein